MVGERIDEVDFRARGSFLDQAVNHLLNEGLDFRAELGKRGRGKAGVEQFAHACVIGRVHEDLPILQHWTHRTDPITRVRGKTIQIRRNPVRREALVVETGPHVFVEEMIDRLAEKGAAGAEIDFIDSSAYHLPATRR